MVVAGMCAGVKCIDDVDVVRRGGMKALFDGMYAPSTIEMSLREFIFGHTRQLESVLREPVVAYRTSDQGGQPIRYRPPASLRQVHPGQPDRRSDAQ
jgi:hypothetical protein